MKLTHVRLMVKNFRECFFFYRDMLDFEVGWGTEESRYAEFKAGGIDIGLFDQAAMAKAIGTEELSPDAPFMDKASLILHVNSVEETYHSLRKRGVTFINEPHERLDWGIKVAHFRDPDHTLIEIYEPLERV